MHVVQNAATHCDKPTSESQLKNHKYKVNLNCYFMAQQFKTGNVL